MLSLAGRRASSAADDEGRVHFRRDDATRRRTSSPNDDDDDQYATHYAIKANYATHAIKANYATHAITNDATAYTTADADAVRHSVQTRFLALSTGSPGQTPLRRRHV